MTSSAQESSKRLGIFVRLAESDSHGRVSAKTLSNWAEHFGVNQTEYIHLALKEKMARDLTAARKTMLAQDQAKRKNLPMAQRWFTPEEAAKVRQYAQLKMKQRAFESTDSIATRFGLNF